MTKGKAKTTTQATTEAARGRRIKAYIQDASGQLIPLDAESLVLEFPSGDFLEVAWDDPHPSDPRPPCAEVWGGRRVTQPATPAEIQARTRASAVAVLPSASNLVLVHPYSFPIRRDD